MSRQSFTTVLHHFRRLYRSWGEAGEASDGNLLERFYCAQDHAAFATLVERHGPLVLGVCRRILLQEQDVEDAFQATFLIMVRKSRAIQRHGSLGSWLYTVAQRVAWNVRGGEIGRKRIEQPMGDLAWIEENQAAPSTGEGDPVRRAQRRELELVIEQELGRLPEKYRAPVVLCDLQGRSHTEAAQELGLPQGSVSRHLERGRDLLRRRLAGRGVGLGAAGLTALLVDRAAAAIPAGWLQRATEASILVGKGSYLPVGIISARAISLCQGVLKAMWLQKVKSIGLAVVASGLLLGGAGWWFAAADASADAQPRAQPVQEKQADAPKANVAEAPVLRCSITEKPQEQQGVVSYISVKEGGLYFSAGGDAIYVQRGGTSGGFGMGGGAFGGQGGGVAMNNGMFRESLGLWSLGEKKKVKDVAPCATSVLSPSGKNLAMIVAAQNKVAVRVVSVETGKVVAETDLTKLLGQAFGGGGFGGGGGGLGGFGIGGLGFMMPSTLAFTQDGKRIGIQAGFQMYMWDPNTNKINLAIKTPVMNLAGFLPDSKQFVGMGLVGGGIPFGQNPGKVAPPVSVWDLPTSKTVRTFGDPTVGRVILSPNGTQVAAISKHMMGIFGGGMGGFGVNGGGVGGNIGGGGFGGVGGNVGGGGFGGVGGGGVGGFGGGGFGGVPGKPPPPDGKGPKNPPEGKGPPPKGPDGKGPAPMGFGGGGVGFGGGNVGFGGGGQVGFAGGFQGNNGNANLGGAFIGGVGGQNPFGGPQDKTPAKIQVFDPATGKLVMTCDTKIVPEAARIKFGENGFMAIPGGITDAAFTPDGRFLASSLGTADFGHVHLWDVKSGKELANIKVPFMPQAITFSRDGTQLATAGGFGNFELRVWDVASLTSPGSSTAFDASQFPNLWKELADNDPAKAYRAERILSGAGAAVLPLLKKNLPTTQESTTETRRVAQLVADLDSDQFKVRDKATQDLAKGGTDIVLALKAASREKRSVEFQRRVQALLSKLEEAPLVLTAEQRRHQRVVAVLEGIGSAEARQYLTQLSRGVPEAYLTQEAQAALQRLGDNK